MKSEIHPELRKVGFITALLTFAPLPFLGNTYYQGLLQHVLIIALFAVALNIAFGHTDQLFLFTGGLAGIGAYATALLADSLGITAWATLPIAGLLTGLVGLVTSWIAAKRQFTVILIAIFTLTFQLLFTETFSGARDITGGSTGFPYEYFSLDVISDFTRISEDVLLYYILLVALVATLLIYLVLVYSKSGLAFDAIREDETAAESIGINVVRNKVIAGFVAAAIIGVGGAFYARSASYITPPLFSFVTVDVVVLVVLIVGGLRTTLGPIVGSILIVGVEQLLAGAPNWRGALFGALLIFLFLYFRNGVVVALQERMAQLREFFPEQEYNIGGG